MPASAAQTSLDEVITHSIDLERVKSSQTDEVLSFLTSLQADIVDEINANGGPTLPGIATTRDDARLNALLSQTQDTIASAYGGIQDALQTGLVQVAKLSSDAGANVLNAGIGADVASSVALSPSQLEKIAGNTLIEGAKSADWWSGQDQDLQDKFAQQMRLGYARGESVDELVARVRGTKASGYTDGLMNVKRNQAEALVRTSIQTVSNAARMETYKANADLLKGIQWVATLDQRTTPICRALDGLLWSLPDFAPIDHNFPYPGNTAHWNCRSTQTPVLKSWSELAGKKIVNPKDSDNPDDKTTLNNAFRQNLQDQGLDEDKVANAVSNARASMDGQVADTTDFNDWLGNKEDATPGFAADLLGPARADLFNKGLVTVKDLIDTNYKTLTIPQLNQLVQDRAAAIAGKTPPPVDSVTTTKIPPPNPPDLDQQAKDARDGLAAIGQGLADARQAVKDASDDITGAFAARNQLSAALRDATDENRAEIQAAYDEAVKHSIAMGKKFQDARAKLIQLQTRAQSSAQAQVSVDPANQGHITFTTKTADAPDAGAASRVADMAKGAMTILQKMVEGSKFNGATPPVFIASADNDQRANYDLKGNILLGADASSIQTGLHELGHWLEDNNASILQASIDFLNSRTAGETAQLLSKLTGNSGYKFDEVAKPDKFFSPYVGKIYTLYNGDTYATEILSMGLEQMWYNPTAFAVSDPDYFDFVYKILRTA